MLPSGGVFANGEAELSESAVGRVQLPACPRPAVTVSKVQDLDVVAVGQERTYTVTYENTG
ncbi:hypothetical protein EII31_07420, partial [Leucobacter sp. OH2974_COT-288]